MRGIGRISGALEGQRGHLLPWVPVCLGVGVGGYFLLPIEPATGHLAALVLAGAGLFLLARRLGEGTAPMAVMLGLVLLGVALAGWRARSVAAPVLGFRFYGAVEGTIVAIDRSASDRLRLTLADVVLQDVAPERTPRRVRIALHAKTPVLVPRPGQRVIATAHLSPPAGPAEPGGFDFRRHAWFSGIGAIGYSRVPVLALAPPEGRPGLFALRMALSRHIRSTLGGAVGGVAAAVSTGDRSGIRAETVAALRASNLAHLLAISGLHLGLLAGFVFAAARLGMALCPPLALRVQSKKPAALLALAAAAAYLVLSGGNVATQRAFVMAAVALVAVLLDRRAFSLRSVALAALIVLLLAPESLLGPGFQMSFAATTALVAVFNGLRDGAWWRLPRWAAPVLAVVVSSLVAGLATAPFGAAHFNVIAHYGLPANLLAVPVMGLVVVPSAVLALCLAPLGLDWIGLWLMGAGLEWILGVAHFFAARPGARGFVPAPPLAVLPLLSLGMLWLILWQGRLRRIGMVPVLCALLLWSTARRPEVLIADSGGLVGVMTAEGRALSKARGQGFVARIWLENDGDAAGQEQAAARLSMPGKIFVAEIAGQRLFHVQGKAAAQSFAACDAGDIAVFTHAVAAALRCRVLTPDALRATGAIAVTGTGSGPRIRTARQVTGQRLWNRGGADR
ncbi:ComEC/Rec2 family competence protein [Shimia sp.]|uniref:ComEC/Rec2 family competence protein n=1 Tax=Shimia sp. TaxID=1954381 RepID=UPI003564AD52